LNLVFSGSDEPFSSPLLHYGVWDNFSPQKNNTQKNARQPMNMKTKIHLKKTRLSLRLMPAATILAALAISIPVSAQTITTFDAPGAGTGALQGTYAFSISPSGTIIGFSRDAADVRHGFVRLEDGDFIIFDAPGAGTAAGQGTRAYSINPAGEITGFFDSGTAAHGYVRSTQGDITVFDAPGAGTGPGQGTFPAFSPLIINANGAITGSYIDSAFVRHGFLRDKNGVIATFDVPGAGLGTFGGGFTPNGTIMGNYFSQDTLSHGFLRDNNGGFLSFDAPGAGTNPGTFEGTYPFGINPSGAITGWYVDGDDMNHGFIRDENGAFTTFDVPGAGTGPGQGPRVFSIAPNGSVTGHFNDPSNVVHGFVRSQ
jgi:hypothetical protein